MTPGTIYFDGCERSQAEVVAAMSVSNCPEWAIRAYIDTAEFGRQRSDEGWEPHTITKGKNHRVVERKRIGNRLAYREIDKGGLRSTKHNEEGRLPKDQKTKKVIAEFQQEISIDLPAEESRRVLSAINMFHTGKANVPLGQEWPQSTSGAVLEDVHNNLAMQHIFRVTVQVLEDGSLAIKNIHG